MVSSLESIRNYSASQIQRQQSKLQAAYIPVGSFNGVLCHDMKLALSCNALRSSGGIERYVMDLVAEISQHGTALPCFASHFDTAIEEYGLVQPHRIRVGWVPRRFREGYFSRRLIKMKRRMSIDIVIGCNRAIGSDIAICGGTHRGSLRAAGKSGNTLDKLRTLNEARYYDTARYVIAHSQLMRKELTELYHLPAEKIVLLYPPVDASRFHAVDMERKLALRRAFGLPEDALVFLFPSSSHERKGYPLLEAFFASTKLPVILLVAGKPVRPAAANIRYVGYSDQIEDLYRAADFTVLASNYEPFGLVGVESVLCGTPLLFADNIGSLEILSERAALRFDRNDPDSLGQAITHILESGGSHARPPLARPAECVLYDASARAHLLQLMRLAKASLGPAY